ncbi:structure-specific endonuclease subunit SLX4 [Odontesthes bonariensis]|uniref:structure-specific endonuclease subunit SLX4 n=1 Tax=Odontesthes bonariensis TaxID=219752 RepID=UPI003F582056
MDDSDQDFVDLCSKLLRRVRKKPGEPATQSKKAEQQTSSQASDSDKRRRNTKQDGFDPRSKFAATQPVGTGAEQDVVCAETGLDSGDYASSVVTSTSSAVPADGDLKAKDKVLLRMQQFKRDNPQRMVHSNKSQPTTHVECSPTAQHQRRDSPPQLTSDPHPEPLDSDEALALRLQQELDREAVEATSVDLEDGGLFFCQICHRDLSHMTPEGRTQHLNRCLDESEQSCPAPPPPSGIPDCPICGKKFKAQTSRSAHLKRCSSDMGVPPAVLLQAVQRQTQESESAGTANTLIPTAGTKRKGPAKSGRQARKKPKKKTQPLDEETMVALALSSSLQEQEKEQQGKKDAEGWLQAETASSESSMTPLLKWRSDAGAGKGRGKRRKAAVPRPPPLLLVQDAEAALTRLQERVSALLLHSRAPSPPTPTRSPSTLSDWTGAAPLWLKSTLLDGGSPGLSDFYAAELREFFTPSDSITVRNTKEADAASSITSNKPESCVQAVGEGTLVTGTRVSVLPSCSQTASCSSAPSTPGTGQLPVGSQALRDLMELAEDGMTLTQYGYSAKDKHLSGFIQEESEDQAELCASGFLLQTTQKPSENTHSQTIRTADRSKKEIDDGSHPSAALSRLAADLSSMVNNPQLSDVQLQVDSGEVFFAHSFMVYARCPLLAEMVHESGFGVQEEGMPAAQMVLLSDVPGQAVVALLQYLYTAQCSIPSSLQPHILELASRFDLKELEQFCLLHQEEAEAVGDGAHDMNLEESANNQTDQAFMELLRSMWNENREDDDDDDDDDGDRSDSDGGGNEGRLLEDDHRDDEVTSGDREICEEQVNEEELEEIYEFAATQKKRDERDSGGEEEEEEERMDAKQDSDAVFAKVAETKRGFSEKNLHPNLEPDPSLDRSYSRLFSETCGVYEEGDPSPLAFSPDQPKMLPSQPKQPQSLHKPSELSCRTLLQSSGGAVNDISLSPPPIMSNLPIRRLSPGQVVDLAGGGDKEEDALKRASQSPDGICIPLSPDSSQKNEEPELIVLSDSSEEMEVDVGVLSSCRFSPQPRSAENLQRYTEIKSSRKLTPDAVTLKNRESASFECLDCSPEVSWLIPSTPVHPGRSMTTSFTQTKSSMCRTQLFPTGDSSPPSSSYFSSPALLFKNKLNTSNSPHEVSTCADTAESSVSRSKLNRTPVSSSSLDLEVSPRKRCRIANGVEVFAVKPCLPKVPHLSSSTRHRSTQVSSKQDTPLHLQPQPYSSTPLHTEAHLLLAPPAASPLHTTTDEKNSSSQREESAASESLEKTELGSFHLSPVSNPSDPVSSSSHGGRQDSKRQSKSSSQSRFSSESGSTEDVQTRKEARNIQEGGETGCHNEATCDEEEQEEAMGEKGEAYVGESSFQQSFMAMDEPPIAFNDSWGLDACAEANPGCFSLRLEDSEGSSLQERSLGRLETARSSTCNPTLIGQGSPAVTSHRGTTSPSLPQSRNPQASSSIEAHTGSSFTPSPPDPNTRTTPQFDNGLLDSKIWDRWEEDEEEEDVPLSKRVNPAALLKTPVSSNMKRRRSLVPITPMPHYSDMDTPDLKNKLNRFGVRPLPKRQMILKLKEIHQYTHQLTSSDSEDDEQFARAAAQTKPPPCRPVTCAKSGKFKERKAPAAMSPLKQNQEEKEEQLSASQSSNTSSTVASEESERSNPELLISSDGDSDSDGGISSSQAASRLQDRLQAVRSFILSDSGLYNKILQYQPLVLSQLQEQLKAAGIRLGAAKLVDYLDSQCITFTTAKPGHSAPGRRRGKKAGKEAGKAARAVNRKKGATAVL